MTFRPGVEFEGIISFVFGQRRVSERVFVYLHGAGGFGKGYSGLFMYPGFATLLRDGALRVDVPFVFACCMEGEHWPVERLTLFLRQVSTHFGEATIDLIGYSRGGLGVYELVGDTDIIRSATVINSRLPEKPVDVCVPLHIIQARHDQRVSFEAVRAFANRDYSGLVSFTAWEGDHFSIEEIVLSGIWRGLG